ncbi:MAG: hypothetical protein ACYTEQ_01460 [Planctomycetota bacterium]|jgi:hypothetical protein
MSKVSFMLIDSPKVLIDKWGYFTEGLENVLKYTHGETTLASIFQQALANEIHIWVAFMDKEYIGFMTTRFDDTPQGKKYFSVLHAYVKPHVDKEFWEQQNIEVDKIAKKYDCSFIRMWTAREKGFARKLARYGWKPMYVEFIKEVEHG